VVTLKQSIQNNPGLSEGMLECDKVMAHAFSHWTGERFGLVTCHNANISLCGATEDTDEFEVIVYNPRVWHDSGWAGV
jgi:hypothetical protein